MVAGFSIPFGYWVGWQGQMCFLAGWVVALVVTLGVMRASKPSKMSEAGIHVQQTENGPFAVAEYDGEMVMIDLPDDYDPDDDNGRLAVERFIAYVEAKEGRG